MGTLARTPLALPPILFPPVKTSFSAWITQKVMFLRDRDWAQVVKTNHFPRITILLWGTFRERGV